jgi:hypothetical protein
LYKWLFFAVTIVLTPELIAQDQASVPTSRADEIHEQRLLKELTLQPEKPTKVEKHFARIDRIMRRSPIKLGVGGRGPGAGLGASSEWNWNSSGDNVRARLWGGASINRFYNVGTGLELPHIGGTVMGLVFEASHEDAPQLEYYGSGPDSSRGNRTSFRREDTLFESRLVFRPHRRFASTCRLGELLLNVGPGTNGSLASTETVFGPAEAPGIDVQSDFLIAGCDARLDARDFPGDPHNGTFASAAYDRYFAQDADRFSFHRVTAAVQHYIPFLNQGRVIALRAKTEFSFHSGDQVVPFYMQTTLGSDADLRGFRRFRFYDENSIVLNAEYRWEISTRFDMALFADAGKVFHRPGEISLADMETSAGFGFRFKNNHNIVARLDTGFSREGFQIWLKFGKLF